MDITPAIPEGRQIVESYGDRQFRISGTRHEGSVLVLPERTLAWPVAGTAEVTLESLFPLLDQDAPPVEVLLLGCGPALAPVDPELRRALRGHGIGIEPMDTGAACRTYNVLLAEQRLVAAALIAVD